MSYLRQHSRYCDLRHLKALGWMVICSRQLSLAAWELTCPLVRKKAQSVERRWRRFMSNARIRVEALYLPLVMLPERVYLALDTTVLWNRYCMIHLSVVCCGRAVPCGEQVTPQRPNTETAPHRSLVIAVILM